MIEESKLVSPFEGGRKTTRVTKKHKPLVWEKLLGTVFASRAGDKRVTSSNVEYFDYDWEAARRYAGVDQCTDLRIAANLPTLWGIPPADWK